MGLAVTQGVSSLGGMEGSVSRYKEAHEVEDEFIAGFPAGTGQLAYKLWTNLGRLHLNWKNYRSLFGTSPGRIDLLNWAAPTFFGLLDGILWHDIILAIARLTDPARSAGKENASLAQLVESLKPFVEPTVIAAWHSQLQDLKTYCKPVRDIRNRLLGHDDLATTLHFHPDPLPGVSRAYIEGALARLRDLLGAIEKHFRGSYTSHQYIISSNDGEALIVVLETAREEEECRERKFDNEG